MKTLKLGLSCVFSILMFNQTAKAGLLLEPYLGYTLSGEIKGASTAKLTGSELGARIGYSNLGFAIGGEYMAGNFKDDFSPSNSYTSNDIGLFVAFKFPVLVRVYASYFPSPQLAQSASGFSATLKSGNVTKLGVGFTGLPFVNINLEYFLGSYSKLNTAGTDFTLSPTITSNAVALSVSAPFNLF